MLWRIANLSPSKGFRSFSVSSRFLASAFPAGSFSSAATSSSVQSYTKHYSTSSPSLQSFNQSSFAVVEEDMASLQFPDELIETDTYNGIIIRLDHATDESEVVSLESFQARLEESLDMWRTEGRKGVWIYVPNSRANLVPIATSLGFRFHMVNKEGLLILSHWLPKDTPSRLPRGPMYQVGVGCIVLKPDDPTQMLVVQEITGPAAKYKLWKMPTGLADPAEDIHEAAVRELQEETGLQAVCDGILVFRQSHAARSGTRAASDLFFVCRMRLVDEKATWTIQPEEIADIRWMPIQEFVDQQHWKDSPLYRQLNEVCLNANSRDVFAPSTLPVGFELHTTNTLYKSQL